MGGSFSAKATGGPVLSDGIGVYQLTARHFWDNSIYPGPTNMEVSELQYCSFDGQEEDEEVDDDDSNYEAMSIASASSTATSQSGSSTMEQAASPFSTPFVESDIRLNDQYTLQQTKLQAGLSVPADFETLLDTATSSSVSKTTRRGKVIVKAGVTPLVIIKLFHDTLLHRGLDYTLLHVPHAERQSLKDPNSFEIEGRSMTLGAASEIPLYRTEIVALCGSSGPSPGILLPGAISHLCDAQSTTIYQVQLESAVKYGDSGSAVVDAAIGSWYGQIVFGCPGTNQAYLVPAINIWYDLNDVQRRRRQKLDILQSDAAEDLHDCPLHDATTQPRRQDSSNWLDSLADLARAITEALPLLYIVASALLYAVAFALLYISLYCFRGFFRLVRIFWRLPWTSSSRGRTHSLGGRTGFSRGRTDSPKRRNESPEK